MSLKRLKKIVFIDDDPATNEWHFLVSKEVNAAEQTLFFISAEDALKYLDTIHNVPDFPELIFVDINMPGMSGHEFIDKVRAHPCFNDNIVLVYLVTTLTNFDIDLYSKKGMKHIYFKTLQASELKHIINKYAIPSERSATTKNLAAARSPDNHI
jgi:CheY-like chemotaxis protein